MNNLEPSINIEELTEIIRSHSDIFTKVKSEMRKRIIGQETFIEKLILALITGGHLLIEGVPGLAKTETIKSLAACTKINSQRIQFTPDLLPADITGTQIYNPNGACFEIKKGPLYSNLIQADEINRAPAKVQSALLEAMAEKSITIGDETFHLEEPFVVLATQNPLEQEGTYMLPEAQMDRFMMKIKIDYPSRDEEKRIMNLKSVKSESFLTSVIEKEDIFKARELIDKIYVDEKIQDYIIEIIFATRFNTSKSKAHTKEKIKDLDGLLEYGASPRASISLLLAAKASAYLHGRAYVIPQDIKDIAHDVLRHRIGLSFIANAEEKTADDLIKIILDSIEVP